MIRTSGTFESKRLLFYRSKSLQTVTIVFAFGILSSACDLSGFGLGSNPDGNEIGQSGGAEDEADGIIATGQFQANGNQTFVLEAPSDSNLFGTSLSIEPGTFAVDAAISIEEAGSLSSALSAASFGVGFDAPAGTAVSIDNDAGITELPPTSPPMTLQIPVFPGNNLLLAGETVLAVLFRQSGDAGNCEEELIPPAKLSVKASSVELKTRKFGAFQALYVSKTDLDKKLSESEDGRIVITRPGCKVITVSEMKKLPEFKISDLSIQRRDRVLGFSATVQGEKVSVCYLSLIVNGLEDPITKQSNLSSFRHDFSSAYEQVFGKVQISCISESSQEASTAFKDFSLPENTAFTNVEAAHSLSWTEGASSSSHTLHPSWTKSNSSFISHQELRIYNDASCTSQYGSSVSSLSANTVSESVTVSENGSYYFKVLTVNEAGYSVWSDCSSGVTVTLLAQPPSPSSLTLTGFGSRLTVAWSSGEGITQGFIVARSSSAISFDPIDGQSYVVGSNDIVYKGSTTEFIDTSLDAHTTYYYKVWAYSHENAYSAPISDIGAGFGYKRWRLLIDSSNAAFVQVQELKLRIDGVFSSGSEVTCESCGSIGDKQIVLISASSENSESEAWKAFDGNEGDSNLWESASDSFNSSTPFDGSAWIEVEFREPVYIDGFSHLSSTLGCPDSYRLEFYDGASWQSFPISSKTNASCGVWKAEHMFATYEANSVHTNQVIETKMGNEGTSASSSICVGGRLRGIGYYTGAIFDSVKAICSDGQEPAEILWNNHYSNKSYMCPGSSQDYVNKLEVWTNSATGYAIGQIRIGCAEGGSSGI